MGLFTPLAKRLGGVPRIGHDTGIAAADSEMQR